MSITYGFYNSLNGDRKYDATQMSKIFDGIINDGIFQSIGDAFVVKASSGNILNVGTGRAWFNHTWTLNDAILPIAAESSEVLLDRIDAVVIEIDSTDSVRANSVKIVKGTPATSPERPTLTNTDYIHQHPLAYISRKAGSTEITQSSITDVRGSTNCPYVTGILKVMTIDSIVSQWEAQWDEWYKSSTAQGNSDMSKWMSEKKNEYDTWFAAIKAILDDNTAAKLASQVVELQGKIKSLEYDHCLYESTDDSTGAAITDSTGSTIEGKIVFKIADNRIDSNPNYWPEVKSYIDSAILGGAW